MINRKIIGIVWVSLLLFGCSSDSSPSATIDTLPQENSSETTNTTATPTDTTISYSYTPNEGRLLASQCFQCHGTNGVSLNSWDSIAGEDNLHDEMFEDDSPIMLAQARGYSDSEISLIEGYLSSLQEAENGGGDDEDDDEHDEDENDDD